jgi:hypothetical protein
MGRLTARVQGDHASTRTRRVVEGGAEESLDLCDVDAHDVAVDTEFLGGLASGAVPAEERGECVEEAQVVGEQTEGTGVGEVVPLAAARTASAA